MGVNIAIPSPLSQASIFGMKTEHLCACFQRLSQQLLARERELHTLFSNFFYVNIFMHLLSHPEGYLRQVNTQKGSKPKYLDPFLIKMEIFIRARCGKMARTGRSAPRASVVYLPPTHGE
jgi:hypothetical protein